MEENKVKEQKHNLKEGWSKIRANVVRDTVGRLVCGLIFFVILFLLIGIGHYTRKILENYILFED